MAVKKTLTDPLNWILLLLAAAFVYYILAVPYFTNLYLKTPQEMTFQEYLQNPAHPRPFMPHALSAPPSSIEVVITGLTVKHIDQDSILLEDPTLPATAGDAVAMPAAAEVDPMAEAAPAQAAPAQDDATLVFVEEAPVPQNQILVAGENLDLVGLSVGQTLSLRTHGLYETPLGWVPREPNLDRSDEEMFTKEELDDLELMRLVVDGNEIPIPYVETGEMRFSATTHSPGEPGTLANLANDTNYIQTASRLAGGTAGGTIDLYDVRLVERRLLDRQPYFVVEDAEGRRARVFFNSRLLSEWYWALDRIGGQQVVARGTLRLLAPGDLRALEAEGNIQAVMDGYAILSRDGSIVINLENPMGGFGPAGN